MQLRNACSLLALALISLPMRAEDVATVATPEPASVALLGGVIGGLLVLHRKFRKKS